MSKPVHGSAAAGGSEQPGRRPRSVVLVGLRCTGKSTVGRALADELGWAFVDSDAALAEAVGQAAGTFLASAGESAFRRAEARVLLPLLQDAEATVVATGGGAVTIAAVRAALADPALLCVWLRADPGVLLARQLAGSGRPALTDRGPAAEIAQLARERGPHYAAVARLTLDTSTADPAATAQAIAEAVRRPATD